MHPELDKLIELAVVNTEITDKERAHILKKAIELGIDQGKVESILNERLNFEKQNKLQSKKGNIKGYNTINTDNIVAAGKSIKSMLDWILIMIVSNIIGALVIINSPTEINPIDYTIVYKILGTINFICSVIILVNLYNAGDDLEKSKLNTIKDHIPRHPKNENI